jgi:hypothetical protein
LDISDDETKQPIGMNANNMPYATTIDGAKERAHNKDENKGDTDSVQSVATESLEGILTQESLAGIPPLQDPPSILKRKKKKQSMLQAASSGTKSGVNPFFAPGKTNKEVIPVEDFKNTVFLELTITVPSKLVGFSDTALKWALQQFTEWFEQAQEDLGDNISLILLSYSMSSSKEPQAMWDVSKFLKGMANTISKHVFNFWPNNKGNEYQLYCKIWIGTNVFGEDLQQLIKDLWGGSPLGFWSLSLCCSARTHKSSIGFLHLIATWILHG